MLNIYPDIADEDIKPGMEAAVAAYRAINARIKANIGRMDELLAEQERAFLAHGMDSPERIAVQSAIRESRREFDALVEQMDALIEANQ